MEASLSESKMQHCTIVTQLLLSLSKSFWHIITHKIEQFCIAFATHFIAVLAQQEININNFKTTPFPLTLLRHAECILEYCCHQILAEAFVLPIVLVHHRIWHPVHDSTIIPIIIMKFFSRTLTSHGKLEAVACQPMLLILENISSWELHKRQNY